MVNVHHPVTRIRSLTILRSPHSEGDMEWIIGKAEELQEMQNNKDGKTQLYPLASPHKKTPQPSGKNSPRDQDECYDVLGDEISDNEIESELAHLFNRV